MTSCSRILKAGTSAAIGAAAVYALTPVADPDLSSRPDPARDYEDAVARIDSVRQAEDTMPLVESGRSFALLHGGRTQRSVVLLHGYTARPDQFARIADAYREAGANVWVPRLPFHGETDPMTTSIGRLTSPLLRGFVDAAVDIAASLGEAVEVVGLSGGGSLAVWSAVTRDEVRRVVAISPLLKPQGYPAWSIMPLVRAYRVLPDTYRWWSESEREALEWGGYPRFSYRGIAAFVGLGQWALRKGRRLERSCPAHGEFVLVANEGDQYIDAAYNRRFAEELAAPCEPVIVDIPESDELLHNLVSVDGEVAARIDLAYAWLEIALGIPLRAPSGNTG
ncbi:MAG: alpha/beta fold hydrolase [Coriobacteriales bacterium]|nr:alpha/beta fold hydrolase [Coriobacteriales bacterium]